MLTSSANQYLRPEYLTPLPTTLDAKKSPLALLAQTCSQIGADSPPTKPLLPPLDKSSKSGKVETPREKSSPASTSSEKPSVPPTAAFKPYESSTPRERTTAASPEERSGTVSRSRTPARVSTTPGTRCASGASATSPRASPAVATATSGGRRTPASTTGTPLPAADTAPAPAAPATTKERANSPALKGTTPFGAAFLADPALKDIPLGTYKPSSYLGYGAHFPSDLSLLAPHHLKPGVSLSPYMSYARMKSAAGAESLVPVCRDPYCSGCQLNSHLLASSGAVAAAVAAAAAGKSVSAASGVCPGGCAQCEHAGKAAAVAVASGAASGAAGFLPSAGGHAAAFAHAQLAALAAASQLPYVCSWIAGDAAYCGKRFASSEELLQHLRSHTTLGAAADALLGSGAAPPPLLPRAYPTPPLSPLAAARFHPYSKPTLLPPSLGLPLHAHPALPPYFSPYALYGQRLGAAAASSMHP